MQYFENKQKVPNLIILTTFMLIKFFKKLLVQFIISQRKRNYKDLLLILLELEHVFYYTLKTLVKKIFNFVYDGDQILLKCIYAI